MEKRVTGICFALLLAGMLYAVFAAFLFRNHMNTRAGDEAVAVWDAQMTLSQDGNVYSYRRILPQEDLNDKVIIYNTVHMYLEVFIDGNKVYELMRDEAAPTKTTGFCWNVISLVKEDAGKEIVFQVMPAYDDVKPKGTFFYGMYHAVEHEILAERFFRLVSAVAIALAGLVMLIYGFFVVKKGQDSETIMQFAIFALMLGTWSICETQVLDWIFPCNMAIVVVSHLMLMAMPIPFMIFLSHMYHSKEKRLCAFCCYVNCAVMAVRIALQVTGISDLRETLLLTHIYLLLFVMVIVVMTVREIRECSFTGQVRINSICIMVILVSTLLELGIYRFGNKSTPLGSIGFLFYIIVMGILNVRRARILMEQARENALYRKLAYTDELTGLANRTAFREDLDKRMAQDKVSGAEKILPTVVFMFDLNDLKKCNDTFGHDYGDQYIQMAAVALKKLFAEEGKCYRIGGDEFCAWAPYTSLDVIEEKLRILEQDIQKNNDKGFVVNVSISAGYAIYEEGVDGGGLYSTMKRADTMMYEKKQEYKRRIGKL